MAIGSAGVAGDFVSQAGRHRPPGRWSREVEQSEVEPQLARHGPRNIEQVTDQTRQVRDLPFDDGLHPGQFLRWKPGQQGCCRADGRQGIAQLVAARPGTPSAAGTHVRRQTEVPVRRAQPVEAARSLPAAANAGARARPASGPRGSWAAVATRAPAFRTSPGLILVLRRPRWKGGWEHRMRPMPSRARHAAWDLGAVGDCGAP